MSHNLRANSFALCAWTQDRLFLLLDGALEPHEENQISAHLETCNACKAAWQTTCHTEHTLLAARENLPKPGDLSVGFYAKLAQTPARSRLQFHYFAAPALAAMLLGVFLWRPTGTQNSIASLSTINRDEKEMAQTSPLAPQKDLPKPVEKPRKIAKKPPVSSLFRKPTRLITSTKPAPKAEPNWLKSGGSGTLASAVTSPRSAQDSRRFALVLEATAPRDMAPSSEMEIEVTDTERGFESKTRTSEEFETNGTRTVTIEESEPTPRIETLLLREEQE